MQKGPVSRPVSLWRRFIALLAVATLRFTHAVPGDVDPNFHGPTNAIPNSGTVSTVVALPNGQFLIAGTFVTDFGLSTLPKTNLARFNADGSIDSTFQFPTATSVSPAIVGFGFQSDGRLIISGNFTTATPSKTNWIRLNIDGSIDPNFEAARPPVTFNVQADDKILLQNGLTRLNADGSLDPDYKPASASTSCSAVLPDQTIVIAGNFTSFGGFPRKGLVRLLPSGQVDPTFAPSAGTQIGSVSTIVPFKTNIWLAGIFRMFGTNQVGGIVRLSADGERDPSFVSPDNSGAGVSQLFPLGDGSVIIRGSFTQISGQPRSGIARLFSDGSLDSNFKPTVSTLRSFAVQSNGDVLIAGGFKTINNLPVSGFTRLLGFPSADSVTFTTVPQSLNGAVGDSIAFQALASGPPPLHYQWFLNDQPIPNATNVTLKYRAVAFERAGQYSVTASNDTSSAQSPPATLALTDIPTPPGSIDRSFSLPTGADGTILQIVVQPDDRILVCGNFLHIDNHPAPGFARLLSDGSYDPSFAPNLGSSILGNQVNALALQPDGKIVVAGRFGSSTNVLRLNADGSPDPSIRKPLFGTPSQAYSVAVEPDGSIIALGLNSRTTFDPSGNGYSEPPSGQYGTNANTILVTPTARYVGGSIINRHSYPSSIDDSVFYLVASGVQAFALQSDGDLLAGGKFQSVANLPNGATRRALLRLDRYGRFDQTFDAALPENFYVRAIVLQSDDRAIIGGSTNQVFRLGSNGETDSTFNPTFDGEINTLALTHTGKLLVGGTFTTVNGESHPRIVRLNLGERSAPRLIVTNSDQTIAQGAELNLRAPAEAYPTPSYRWLFNGTVLTNETNSVLRRASFFASDAGEYSVIVSNSEGSTTNTFTVSAAAAPNTPGSVNLSWFNSSGFNGTVNAFLPTLDKKLIVGGDFIFFNGAIRWNCLRLNADHSLDDTLMTGPSFTNGFDGPITSLASLPDGSFILGGSFSSSALRPHRGLARIGADGVVDPTFFSDAGFTNFNGPFLSPMVTSVVLQGSSNILVGGTFRTCNNLDRPGVARIQLDGSLDTNLITADFGPIMAVAVETDQKIWAGGTNIVRLNADGTTDLVVPWNNSTNDYVTALLIQPDGKILVGGVALGGHSLIRLNSDGTPDASFTPLDLDTNSTDIGVYTLELQADGKIIAGGKFTTANGTPVSHILRLNSDGTIDTSFKTEISFVQQSGGKTMVNALRLDSSGKLFVGGYFDRVNGIPRYCAAVLETGPSATPQPTLHLIANESSLTINFETQPGVTYTVESTDSIDTPNWQPMPNGPHNSGSVQVNVSGSSQFFRVTAQR